MTNQMGALRGLKIIDLSRVLGGPYCSQALADHGAEVIKLEPLGGDETRGWGPLRGRHGVYFKGVNRNKKGIAVDLATAEGIELLLRLLEDADVLLENFKPGTLARWGSATRRCFASASRGWSTARYRASAPTARSAACPATTRRSRRWPD